MSVLAVSSERRELVVRGPVSCRVPYRLLASCVLTLLLVLLVSFAGLMVGDTFFSPGEVLTAIVGEGSRSAELFVSTWRLPRVVGAAAFGAMLGASGAIFQTVTRNPLGSPDIIGFTTGAYTGGLVAILLVGGGYAVVAGGAVAGGLVVGAVVYLLSRRGGLQGFRLILVGIAITAMLASFDTWLILTADLDQAIVAAVWGVGSLNGVIAAHVWPAVTAGAVLLFAAAAISRRLAQLDLGDDQAAALGSTPERTRLLGILVGVLLVAVVTSVAGPIAFIALAAPQIGRRLGGATGTPMLPAAVTGALLLSVADLAAQHAVPGFRFPVGLVTVAIGGLYLLAVIVRENTRGSL